MATQKLVSVAEVANTRSDLATMPLYGSGVFGKDASIFTDEDRTIRVGAFSNLGFIQGKRLWNIKTNANGRIVDNPILVRRKKIGFQPVFPDSRVSEVIAEMVDMKQKGVELIQLNIALDAVYWDKTEFDANDSARFANYDPLLAAADANFGEIAIRFVLGFDDGKSYFKRNGVVQDNPLFSLQAHIAKDQWGNEMRVKEGIGHGSFFNNYSRNIMTTFIQRVLTRYSNLANKISWVSFCTTPDQETGNAYSQRWTGSEFLGSYNGNYCMYDYHQDSLTQWPIFLAAEYLGDIGLLNTAYGTSFTEFSQVEPPMMNVSSIADATFEIATALAQTAKGKDWQKHNFVAALKFYEECKTVVSQVCPNAKACYEAGSVTDKLSLLRFTQNITEINKHFTLMKAQFSGSNWNNTVAEISVDVIRRVWAGDIHCEINDNDVTEQSDPLINESTAIQTAMLNAVKSAYKNGADCVILISKKQPNPRIQVGGVFGVNQWPKTLQVAEDVNIWLNLGNGFLGVTTVNSVNISLDQRLRNYDASQAVWVGSGVQPNDTHRVDVNITGEALPIPPDPELPNPNSVLYWLNNDPDHTGIQTYVPKTLARVEFLKELYNLTDDVSFDYLHTSHAIGMIQSKENNRFRALCDLTVTGVNTGKIYARTLQNMVSEGLYQNAIRDDMVIVGENSIKAGNNHVRNIDLINQGKPAVYRDLVIKLPKTEPLNFKWVNRGTIRLEINLIHPDSAELANNGVEFAACLDVGDEFSFTYYPLNFTDPRRWKQAIKSQMNGTEVCNSTEGDTGTTV